MLQVVSKIRSQRGASLSMALLLFLVCSVVSAIVLVAGTAASGRLANLVSTDQRYYTVVSAMELVKDELAKDYLVVEETLTYIESTTDGGNSFQYKVTNCESKVKDSKGAVFPSTSPASTLSIMLDKYLAYGNGTNAGTTWPDAKKNEDLSADGWEGLLTDWESVPTISNGANTLNLTLDVNGNSELAVDIEAQIAKTGNITMTFTSPSEAKVGNASGVPYSATMTLTPTNDPEISSKLVSEAADGTTYEETKRTVYLWTVDNIVTGKVNAS